MPRSSEELHLWPTLSLTTVVAALVGACGGGRSSDGAASATATPSAALAPAASSDDGSPAAGYAGGHCAIPAAAQAVSVTTPDHVVGNGTAASCTSDMPS